MNYHMFTQYKTGLKIGINKEAVDRFEQTDHGTTIIFLPDTKHEVEEDFSLVISRLNTIAK